MKLKRQAKEHLKFKIFAVQSQIKHFFLSKLNSLLMNELN